MKNIKSIVLLLLTLTVVLAFATSCDVPEFVKDFLPNEHVHAFADATCTSPKTCECGATEGEALGHNAIEVFGKAPTCTEPGQTNFVYCDVCGENLSTAEEIAPLGHTFVEGKCECGAEDPNYVPPHEHSYTSVVTAPTCTEAGFTTYTCACGDTYTADEVAALGHKHTTVVTAPTCTEAGFTTYTCACGNTYKADEVPATGHKHTTAVTAPTCTEAGFTTYTCACGDTYKADEVPATGHKFINGTCTACSEVYVPTTVLGDWTLVTELKDGDRVLIGVAAYGKLLSAEKVSASSYYNKGVNYSATDFSGVTDAEIFVVTVNADGTYTFTSVTGDVIALAASYSSLNKDGEHKTWTLTDRGDGTFLMKNVGRNTYLEWYSSKNNWSTYTAGNTTEYYISFYAQQTVEAGDHVHNHITEDHAPTCTEAGYTSYTCACGDTYKVDGAAATGHSYTPTVTAPTCTEAGFTTHTCACGDTYKTDEVPATGHTFVEGKCECGEKDASYVPPFGGGSADFNTIVLPSSKPNGDSSYTATYTTANGWVTTNSAIQCGGTTNMNPQFTVIGANNTFKAPCLNGKTTAYGTLTSPTLVDGVSKIVIKYTKMFTDTALSMTVTVTDANGNKYTHVIEQLSMDKNEKYVVYTAEWVLETPVTGDFTIEIVNNCPSNSTSNKDRITILDLTWEGATPKHEHNYENVVATPATCTTAGSAIPTCSCGETLEAVEVAKLGHIDENLDIECDREGCSSKVAPAAESTLSISTANNLGSKLSTSGSYYVEGVIVEVLDAKNGIFLIADKNDLTGETFYFRLPKDADGVSHSNWTVKLTLGDHVKVYGKVNKFTTNTAPNGQFYPSIQGGLVEVLERHPHIFGEPTCLEPGYCACGQDGPVALGHIDENTDNLCDRCSFNLNLVLENIVVRTDNNSGVVDTTAQTYTWSGENFYVQVSKGSGSMLYTTAKDHMRVYKNSDIIFGNTSGKVIDYITITVTNATQLNNFKTIFAGYTFTADEANLTLTVEIDSAETFTIKNSTTSTIQFKSVEFAYEK